VSLLEGRTRNLDATRPVYQEIFPLIFGEQKAVSSRRKKGLHKTQHAE
jgi:hypothetical protein